MLSEIFDGLWIGSGDEVRDMVTMYKPVDDVEKNVGVLNVADDYKEFPHHRAITYVHAGLNDGPPDWSDPWGEHNSSTAYLNAICMLDHMMFHFKDVFVFCHGGVSRSSFIVTMYLVCCFGVPYDLAKRLIKEAHTHANIHPKHDDRVPLILEEIRGVPFISSMRMKDAAIQTIFRGMGIDNWIEGLFSNVRPDLHVVKGGVADGERTERPAGPGETEDNNPG